MSTLSDGTIRRLCETGDITYRLIKPFFNQQLQPASYDLILDHILDFEGRVHDFYPLLPHEFILGSTEEWVNIPSTLVARIEGKSSLARKGIMVHTAGFIDPGFRGKLTLEITNHSAFVFDLRKSMKIAQLAFQHLDFPAERPYGHPELGSHYQDQKGAMPSALG